MQLSWLKKPELPDVVLIVGSASLVLVCLFLLAVPGFTHLRDRAREARIKGNALTLQLAAETYAYRHEGQYALDALDLLTYLPDDCPPTNPFTREPSEFCVDIGDLTYRSPRNGGDYIIEAWGPGEDEKPQRLLTLSGVADKSADR